MVFTRKVTSEMWKYEVQDWGQVDEVCDVYMC